MSPYRPDQARHDLQVGAADTFDDTPADTPDDTSAVLMLTLLLLILLVLHPHSPD